jgi:MraZ protein
MAKTTELILGEYPRQLDERYRVSIPQELVQSLIDTDGNCTLAKERPGCLSLWNTRRSQDELDTGMDLVRGKIRAGKLEGRLDELQLFGRLLSTRQRAVKIAGRGRLLVPEGFREFLGVEQGGEVLIIGAAICVEIWRPEAWVAYLEKRIPRFRRIFDSLTG